MVAEAVELEGIGTKHDQLPDVSEMYTVEEFGEVGWLVCRLIGALPLSEAVGAVYVERKCRVIVLH